MHELHGDNLIAGVRSREGSANAEEKGTGTFNAVNPATAELLAPSFCDATAVEVDRALEAAQAAFWHYRRKHPEQIATFLETIAEELLALGDQLLLRARDETGLTVERLTAERARTAAHLRMFGGIVREGSWLDACIDRGDPERTPTPKPDIRRMSLPLGPVVVFGASNFPLAYSVLGGDTASALAAGCPVVVKAHPAHPGTSELAATALLKALERCGMPAGVFSLLHGTGRAVGSALVIHPVTTAVGFTGSLSGGRALYNAAASRARPIPVYAEMGSVNPVFVLPRALQERGAQIAQGIHASATLAAGQFCVAPGMVLAVAGAALDTFSDVLGQRFSNTTPATMLHAGILASYNNGLAELEQLPGVTVLARSATKANTQHAEAEAVLLRATSATVLAQRRLSEEVFGPSTIVIDCDSTDALNEIANTFEGYLTATVHGTNEDLAEHKELISILETKVGRLIVNGYPTGVEVCHSMQHGGPYPATTDSRTTSVGPAAIHRFARPVCYQNFPDDALPKQLQNKNTLGICRRIDGQYSKEDVA